MSNISSQDARNLMTKELASVYKEKNTPTAFLRSFFPSVEKGSKEISIEVERGKELVAVDVVRGTEGNRNTWSRTMEKIFVPPYFREYFDATDLDAYDKMFGQGEISYNNFGSFINSASEKLVQLTEKIERSYELQCAQVFETGIVTINKGTNIDFKRKAASLVDLSGTPWTAANDPFAQIEAGCAFLRTKGKMQGNMVNMLLGSEAITALFNNADFKEQANSRRMDHVSIRMPQKESVGATSHGVISCGDYLVAIWSYPEYYDTESSANNSYLNTKKMVLMPEKTKFQLTFAAVPQLIDGGGVNTTAGAYRFGDYRDMRNHTHIFDVRSAGIAIPVAVDQIYTAQVVA